MSDNPLHGKRLFIVDDEDFARSFLRRILDRLEVEVVGEAVDGEDALAKLAEVGASVDAIICDIEMPNLDGFELVRRLRFGAIDGLSQIPFLMLTGRDTEGNVRSARIHKINGFILKPPKQSQVGGALRAALKL